MYNNQGYDPTGQSSHPNSGQYGYSTPGTAYGSNPPSGPYIYPAPIPPTGPPPYQLGYQTQIPVQSDGSYPLAYPPPYPGAVTYQTYLAAATSYSAQYPTSYPQPPGYQSGSLSSHPGPEAHHYTVGPGYDKRRRNSHSPVHDKKRRSISPGYDTRRRRSISPDDTRRNTVSPDFDARSYRSGERYGSPTSSHDGADSRTVRKRKKSTDSETSVTKKRHSSKSKSNHSDDVTENEDDDQKSKTGEVTCRLQEMIMDSETAMLGLSFITEFQTASEPNSPKYTCSMCDCNCGIKFIVAHITGLQHRTKFIERFYEEEYKMLVAISDRTEKRSQVEFQAMLIEADMGREKVTMKVTDSPDVLTIATTSLESKQESYDLPKLKPSSTATDPQKKQKFEEKFQKKKKELLNTLNKNTQPNISMSQIKKTDFAVDIPSGYTLPNVSMSRIRTPYFAVDIPTSIQYNLY